MRINVATNLGLILTKNANLRHMSVAALIGMMAHEVFGDTAEPECSHPTTVTKPAPVVVEPLRNAEGLTFEELCPSGFTPAEREAVQKAFLVGDEDNWEAYLN